MAVTRATFASMDEFAAWAAQKLVPRYFKASDYSGGTFTGYRDTGKTEPLWTFSTGFAPDMKAYRSATSYRQVNGTSLASDGFPQAAWLCANGVILDIGYRQMAAIITKTSTGETAAIIGGDQYTATSSGANITWLTGNSTDAAVYCTAYGDDTSITEAHSWIAHPANQTALCPFQTDAPLGSTSFTPYAYYMPFGQFYGLGHGKFTAAGKTYITNGHWAILDG